MQINLNALASIKLPSDVQLSPDGRSVAFIWGHTSKPSKDAPVNNGIYLININTKSMHCLTTNEHSTYESPCWSPDGKHLAFISNQNHADEMQLYLMTLENEEVLQCTDLRGCVSNPKWMPDGSGVSFLYSGSLTSEKRVEDDPIVVNSNPSFSRVWLYKVGQTNQSVYAITPKACHIFEYIWSADSTRLAVLADSHPNPAEGWYSAQLFTVDALTSQMRQICQITYQAGRLTWSPDGKSIAFLSGIMSDEGNISGEAYIVSAEGGEAKNITPDIDHSVTWIEWRRQGILYGGRYIEGAVLGWIDPSTGGIQPITRGDYSINGIGPQYVSVALDDSTFAAIRESFIETPNIYIGSLALGTWDQLTDLPLDHEDFPPLRVENLYWSSSDGVLVHGFLVYPRNYEAGRQYPLFLNVHGGPSWSYVPRYVTPWARLISAYDCFGLMPNPRGSWGRGYQYQIANVGDLGGGDWRDVNAGIDCLIEQGLVDPNRLAVGGWSYGGYLTAWAITQSDRFRCAIAGASITNFVSNYGVVSNREWQTTMFASTVYDEPDLHISRSPINFAKQIKTPTLLVHGDCDTLAPLGQSIELYTALQHCGIPSQLVIYPREPHGFMERPHLVDLYRRIGEWIDKYLLA
jgi:dipeptidyl aminopeptidase/acylaminoacyl peptidase